VSRTNHGPEPLDRLDALFGGVASGLGANAPESIAAELPDDEKAAINNILSLVGAHKLTHTLNRYGEVIVPALDGRTEVVLDPRLLEGEEWVNAYVVVLVDLAEKPAVATRVDAFLQEANRYYGAKFVRAGEWLQAMADVPATGLNPQLLLSLMRRLLAVVENAAEEIDKIGFGRRPRGVFQELGYPILNPLQLQTNG
jgi:hypothetical protein